MAKNSMVLEIKPEEQLKILFLGEEFPFISEILRQRLEDYDCEIYSRIAKVFYDYILVFGKIKDIGQSLKHLKQGGKILAIVSDEADKKAIKEKIPAFVLSLSETLTSEKLAEQILQELFSAKPHEHTDEELKKIKNKTISRSKKSKKLKISKKVKLFFLLSVLLTLPLAIFISSLFLSVRDLFLFKNQTFNIQEQEKIITKAKREFTIADKIASAAFPVSSYIFPSQTEILKESLNILDNLLLSAEEVLSLEKIIKKEGRIFFAAEENVLDKRLSQVKGKLFTIDNYLASAEISVKKLEPYRKSFFLKNFWSDLEKIEKGRKIIKQSQEAITVLPDFLGFPKKKNYLLLFQNNFELRPTGGFIGSYAVLTLEDGVFSNMEIHDVYDADGQLKGKVEPPKPIAEILNQPNWFLRDSNWDPDFAYSARQAEWFLQKETGERFDGVLAFDLYFVKNILRVLGEVYVADYQAKVTADDFFFKLQADVHEDFFPGSSQKKDLLSALSSSLMIEVQERENLPYLSLFQEIIKSLDEKHLLLYLHGRRLQTAIDNLGWGGRILEAEKANSDYLMLVEANLGVNKANYNIERDIVSHLSLEKEEMRRKVTIYYKNKSDNSQNLTSGVYKNYLRLLLPQKAKIDKISIDEKELDLRKQADIAKYQQKTAAGFLVEVLPNNTVRVEADYRLPISAVNGEFSYQFLIQKQPGIDKFPFIFKIKEGDSWMVEKANISSFPYTAELVKDKLLIIDFSRRVK